MLKTQPEAFEISRKLTLSQDVAVKLFGFNVMEDLIKYRWDSIKLSFKQFLVDLISNSEFNVNIVSDKVSRLFTLAIVKLFPQWTELNEYFKSLYGSVLFI